MHGFGTGLGIFYAMLAPLAEKYHGRVIAIDSLGCGLSSKPPWSLPKGEDCPISEAEDFFTHGIERWREAMDLDRVILMGHSLGGYLAVAYAQK